MEVRESVSVFYRKSHVTKSHVTKSHRELHRVTFVYAFTSCLFSLQHRMYHILETYDVRCVSS